MQYSKSGLALTERFESCSLTAFWDPLGECWTIAWGHTFDVHEGDTCTQEQADEWADKDTEVAQACVNGSVFVPLAQGEFDALVDFVYNLGCQRFRGSTLRAKLNKGDISGAADEFPKWKYASGKVVEGLLRRRLAEQAEFKGEN